jgi:hypothetical protein
LRKPALGVLPFEEKLQDDPQGLGQKDAPKVDDEAAIWLICKD